MDLGSCGDGERTARNADGRTVGVARIGCESEIGGIFDERRIGNDHSSAGNADCVARFRIEIAAGNAQILLFYIDVGGVIALHADAPAVCVEFARFDGHISARSVDAVGIPLPEVGAIGAAAHKQVSAFHFNGGKRFFRRCGLALYVVIHVDFDLNGGIQRLLPLCVVERTAV